MILAIENFGTHIYHHGDLCYNQKNALIRRVVPEDTPENDVCGGSIVLESSMKCTYEQLIEIILGKPVDRDIDLMS